MKSEKGITLTSLIIYIIAMAIVIGVISTISNYFYSNIGEISRTSNTLEQVTKLNSFITDEINKTGNTIYYCSDNVIIFYNSNDKDELNSKNGYTQYTFKGNSIYLNKIKICKNIENCRFEIIEDDIKYKFKVYLTVNGNEKEMKYTLKETK